MELLEFILSAAGTSADTTRLLAFLLFGAIGAFMHYLKKWLNREIKGSLWRYCFQSHPRDTISAVVAFAGAAFTLHLGNQLVGMSPQALLLLAFTTGYACDSALNKGSQE